MLPYEERTYRKNITTFDLVCFNLVINETDLWISAEKKLINEARDLVLDCRQQLETYIKIHPEFVTSLFPLPQDPCAPGIVKKMIDATRHLGVGPMAAVAGSIAQHVAEGLLQYSSQAIVENGGDIYLKTLRPVTVSIFAGESPLSEKFALKIPVRQMPLAVCSSSAKVGHSLSMGISDVSCILSSSAAYADGAATAVGNRIKTRDDMETAANWAGMMDQILGGVIIVDDRIACWGDIELVAV